MEEILNDKIEYYKDELLKSIIDLVNIGSIKEKSKIDAPFGEMPKAALVKALEIAEDLGFKTKNLDNYIGYAQYGEGENYIGVLGHLDVVPVGEGWKFPPFSGHIENGKIYGRGVLDNKGPIISALYALYAIKEAGLKINKPVRIIFGTDEESGFNDIPYYLEREKPPIMGFTPDCKYPVVYGERGRANIQFQIEYNDENYERIIEEFFNFLNTYILSSKSNGDRLGINFSDEEFGTMEMRNYNIGIEESKLLFNISLSYPAIVSIDEILEKMESKLSENIKLELLLNYNPVKFEKDSFLVRSLQKAYEDVTNLDGTPVTTTGGTYAKIMPNIVPFGPSFPGQKGISHNPNEYMDISDIILNAKIFSQAIYNLAK
ncbi:Sapep family Mn(2+)-dependent dipeptidase [Anaerosalibacter massiliensis]|uniref:Sapep family Mn(2+)-dependent dipeptidase n=1 Tax=Anaerosalibacter massiliensis TaxID=1347392 RepID=A0A9X2ML32_9FIRM|nr:Sapep family Mn(2+)-dependent dipeptidase [Anaerosalibacter massiliensis]MCR2045132.1 Sapep family Mn(2+)-dependent dipeptidase [Anaerosalibacter massiliensis]